MTPFLFPFSFPDPIGYVDGLDTYLFVKDGPVRKVDPDGMQTKLSYDSAGDLTKDVQGVFAWPIRFIATPAAKQTAMVIQHMTFSYNVTDKNGKAVKAKDIPANAEMDAHPNYWEPFNIFGDKSAVDTWSSGAWGKCTKGKIEIKGTATLYENVDDEWMKKYNKFFHQVDLNGGGITGLAQISDTDPDFGKGSDSITRTLAATWDCGNGGVDNKTVVVAK